METTVLPGFTVVTNGPTN